MSNADQESFWAEEAGPVWVARQRDMDATLAPVLDAVLSRAELRPGQTVLDIGCGAGESTRQAAAQAGAACGLDISDSLLRAAREQYGDLPGLSFLKADAQTHDFAPGVFDVLMSRFGVMFFSDFPAAFANMGRALTPGGRMVLATWGAVAENPYFTLPAEVAKSVLGPMPKSDRDAPGPFALRKPARIEAILAAAGLADVTVTPTQMELTPPGDRAAVADLLCDIGPIPGAFRHFEASEDQRAEVRAALHDALARFDGPQGVRLPAEINIVTATTR